MDTLTHAVLGACTGEIICGKQIGKKALILGAIANNIPDIDFVAAFWMPVSKELLAHRGFTHSILFAVLLTPLLALVSTKLYGKPNMPYNKWLFFWGIQVFIHLFIDSFNAYGTGLFEPFSHYRLSFNTVFVADPLFSAAPGIGFIILLLLKRNFHRRKVVAGVALALCTAYLVSCIAIKLTIDNAVDKDLKSRGITVSRYFTTPTPLNNLLWFIVAQNDSGFYLGYRSLFDRKPAIDYHYAAGNGPLLATAGNNKDVNNLLRFSQGYYTIDKWQDTLVFNDLRFGEMLGWQEQHPRFVFHYYLNFPNDNKVVVQRGRFAGWNKKTLQSFVARIKGI
jgi:inner membrane protein